MVAEGEADVGFGLETAARAFGLEFIPLVKERYDLVIPEQNMKHHEVDLLVKWLKDENTRKAISALGGYDTQDTGMLTWVHPL